jgi:hypothetical protein
MSIGKRRRYWGENERGEEYKGRGLEEKRRVLGRREEEEDWKMGREDCKGLRRGRGEGRV